MDLRVCHITQMAVIEHSSQIGNLTRLYSQAGKQARRIRHVERKEHPVSCRGRHELVSTDLMLLCVGVFSRR